MGEEVCRATGRPLQNQSCACNHCEPPPMIPEIYGRSQDN